MNIFPFYLDRDAGTRLFHRYILQHKAELDEKYGIWCLTTENGVTGQYKLFHWYEVDVEVLSPTEVRFVTFGMADPVRGGRGAWELEIPATLDCRDLADLLEAHKRCLAEQAFDEETAKLRAERRRAGINLMYRELFGESE